MKPGIKTTEFWLALIAQLVPVLVIAGVLSPEEADTFNSAIVQVAAAGVALASAVVPIWRYIESRTEVKKTALQFSRD